MDQIAVRQPGNGDWRGALRRLSLRHRADRLRVKAVMPPPAATAEEGPPPILANPSDTPRRAVLAVTLFGIATDAIGDILDTVTAYADKRGVVPVFLTDCDRFEAFRARGAMFEYIPGVDAQKRFAPDLPWPQYVERRLHLFHGKWRPAGVVAFGDRLPMRQAFREVAEIRPWPT